MDTGRNDPCPCGSGRKSKECCLRDVEAPPPADLLWNRINRADEALTVALLGHAKRRLGPDAAFEARRDFWGEDEEEELHGEDLQMFVP